MATAWFGPCPHCHLPLSYLEGVSGSTLNPACPRCKATVAVECATFLMADHSRPLRYGQSQQKPSRTRTAPKTLPG